MEDKNITNHTACDTAVRSLAKALEAKDNYTKGHSEKVANLSRLIAQEMSFDHEQITKIEFAGLLHDLGKIGIREDVLNKTSHLTSDEYEHVKGHPIIAAYILEPLQQFSEIISDITHHHERYDGSGYPNGLKGDRIPIGARILMVADTYDAMTSDRPHRSARPHHDVVRKIVRDRGKKLDAETVDAFLRVYKNSLADIPNLIHYNVKSSSRKAQCSETGARRCTHLGASD